MVTLHFALGYMLEHLSIRQYSFLWTFGFIGSVKICSVQTISRKPILSRLASACWNEWRILRDYTPGNSYQRVEDIVRAAWRHAEVDRNDQPADVNQFRVRCCFSSSTDEIGLRTHDFLAFFHLVRFNGSVRGCKALATAVVDWTLKLDRIG